jgi:hypothetical protein
MIEFCNNAENNFDLDVFNIFDNMKWQKKIQIFVTLTSCTLGKNMFINLQDNSKIKIKMICVNGIYHEL